METFTLQSFIQELRADWAMTAPFLIICIATIFIDVAFGLCRAWSSKTLCSSVSRTGMMRKILKLATALLAAMFDGILPTLEANVMGMAFTLTFASLACIWWVIHELLSIIENAALLGLPVPRRLKEALSVIERQLEGKDKGTPPPKV